MMRANTQTLVGYFLGGELFMGTRAHAMIGSLLADVASGQLTGGHRSSVPPG